MGGLLKVEAPVLGFGAYRRNVIINGDFCIAQRAAGALSTSWVWSQCDRWQVVASGTGVSGTMVQGANGGGIKRLGLFVNSANFTSGTIAFRQRIEASLSMGLRGNVYTARAKIYHDTGSAMNFQFAINVPTLVDNWTAENTIQTSPAVSIPSGVVTEMIYTFPALPDTSDGWNGLALAIRSTVATTVSNKSFGITNVSLESGPQATPFENVPYAEQLALCQRYFEKSYDMARAPGATNAEGSEWFTASGSSAFPVARYRTRKRSQSHTFACYSPVTGAASMIRDVSAGADIAMGSYAVGEMSTYMAPTVVDQRVYYFHWTADAELS